MILSGDTECATRRWTTNADIWATKMTLRYLLRDHPAISRYQKREHRLLGEARPNRSKCSCHHDKRTWNIERARGDISQQFHIRATIRSLAYRTMAVSSVPPEGASHLWRDSVTDAHSNRSALRMSRFESIRSDPCDQVRLSYISPLWPKSQRKPGDLEVRTKIHTCTPQPDCAKQLRIRKLRHKVRHKVRHRRLARLHPLCALFACKNNSNFTIRSKN